MMNTETLILMHLLNHQGNTPSQIAEAIGRATTTVSVALSKMIGAGDVWRDEYFRYFSAVPDAEEDQKFVELSDKAYSLQDKSWWNRAANVWLLAFDATKNPGLREKAKSRRKECIEMANWIRPKPEPDYPERRSKHP
ncbi:MAG: MarR family winged helix-turn-helix transcriptional regulator [Pantoea sp.]|uniref:MarR family winged helix-turn-helix transcriptional regulator n=1 Tax=Pantoea sp. TaxID=69393 RepID=UPI00238B9031|nr:MarR family winged helix-turn-helix transcriptional regulator [Pantoea sp.]MDE1188225.1 MarR family winged helix-turn-helix transcriptional regulator [Pantoea sp.]